MNHIPPPDARHVVHTILESEAMAAIRERDALRLRVAALEHAIKITGATCLEHEDSTVPMSEDDCCAFCVAAKRRGEDPR